MHTLGTDLFYHRKQDYLVLVDYFSKFLIVRKLPNSTTGAIVKELSITFSEYGIHSSSGQTMVPATPHKNSRHSSKTYKLHIVPALHTTLNPMVWWKVW